MPPLRRNDSTVRESSDHIPPTVSTVGLIDDSESEPFFSNPGWYQDKFIDINPETNTLTIKKYLLVKSIRHIHVSDILHITPASELYRIGVKVHGISATGIIWALDWSRGVCGSRIERSFVIKVKGDTFRVGFSVEHREKFLEVLEYLHPGVTTRPDSYREAHEPQLPSEGGLIESDS